MSSQVDSIVLYNLIHIVKQSDIKVHFTITAF